MRNLVNFDVSSGKSENLHFDVLLLLIVYEVLVKKSQEKLSLMTLKRDSNFEEKLTFCLKITRGIRWTLTKAAASLKICTLMDYFFRKYVMFELKKYRGVVCCEKWYNEISNFVNFHTIAWKLNPLHIMFYLKECIFWTNLYLD